MVGVSNFWEAPWLFKRNGVYYLAYLANDSACSAPGYACIRYAAAGNPMGPWTHRGVVPPTSCRGRHWNGGAGSAGLPERRGYP